VHGYGETTLDIDGNPISIFGTIQDITKRKKIELELLKNRDLLQRAEIVAGLGRFRHDINNDTWDSSVVLNKILGIDKNFQRNTEGFFSILHPDYRKEMKELLERSLTGNISKIQKELKIIRINNKEERWIQIHIEVIHDSNKKQVYSVGTIQDITERKEIEIELLKSKDLLQKAESIAGIGRYYHDLEKDIWQSSIILDNILGIDNNYTKNFQSFFNIIHPDFRNQMMEFRELLFKADKIFNKELKIIRVNDKQERWIHIQIEIKKNSNNKPESTFGTIQDITERKKAELAIIANEEKYRMLFEHANDAIFLMDNEIFIDCNDKTLEMFACTKEQIIGQPPYRFSPKHQPDGRKSKEKALEKINNALKGKSKTFEWIHTKYNGEEFFAEVSLNVFKFQNKDIIQAIVRDISERKEAGDAIRLNEEKFRNIFNNSSDTIIVLDANGNIIDVNQSITKNLQYKPKEIIGHSILSLITDKYKDDVVKRISLMNGGKKAPLKELDLIAKDGTIIPFEVNSKPINYNNQKAILSVIRNIKVRKELEQRIFDVMIESEEKERQRLASDIHDEIGPVLSSLKMYIESLGNTTDIDKQKFIKDKLQSLIKETITNVREVSNDLSPNLLLKHGIVKAIKSFFNANKGSIHIDFKSNIKNERFGVKIETVYYRILKELFNNTIKHANATKITIELNLFDNDLVLEYKDNGKGINRLTLEKTKTKGLGLSNIENRIKTINGMYDIETDKDIGFGFNLRAEVKTII
ncbi:PAS domain S-box protein, partial [Bacteroidota bacterium]